MTLFKLPCKIWLENKIYIQHKIYHLKTGINTNMGDNSFTQTIQPEHATMGTNTEEPIEQQSIPYTELPA